LRGNHNLGVTDTLPSPAFCLWITYSGDGTLQLHMWNSIRICDFINSRPIANYQWIL